MCRSRCGSSVTFAENTTGIRPICLRDLQPRIPERPKPTDAQEEAQGAMEVAQEGEPSWSCEEESICLP